MTTVQKAKIGNQEILEFVNYVNEFYNPETGIFPIKGATVSAIVKAINTYIQGVYESDGIYVEGFTGQTWGGGDSVDRERVRDIIIQNGGEVIA